MQRESKGNEGGVWRREEQQRKRKKIPKSLASELPEFIQFISTTTQKVKSANGLQSNATQSSALKIPFLGNSRKRRKSRNIATLSFRLPDLWLFETGASRAQEILDYSHFFQEAWKQTKHNSSRPAAGVKECKLLFQQQKKNITDMIQDFFPSKTAADLAKGKQKAGVWSLPSTSSQHTQLARHWGFEQPVEREPRRGTTEVLFKGKD